MEIFSDSCRSQPGVYPAHQMGKSTHHLGYGRLLAERAGFRA